MAPFLHGRESKMKTFPIFQKIFMPTYYSAFQSVVSDTSYQEKSRRNINDERDDAMYSSNHLSSDYVYNYIDELGRSEKEYLQFEDDYESRLREENAALKYQLSLARTEIEHLQNSKQQGPTLFCSLVPKKYTQMKSDLSSCGVVSDAPTIRMGSSKRCKETKVRKPKSNLGRGVDHTTSCVRSFIYGKRLSKANEEDGTIQRTEKRQWKPNKNGVMKEERDDRLNKNSWVNFSKNSFGQRKKSDEEFVSQTRDVIKRVENFPMKSNSSKSTLYYDHEEVEVINSHLPVIYESLQEVFNVDDKIEI